MPDVDELRIARACLTAITDGPFVPDWEFQTVMGITRAEAQALLMRRDADLMREDLGGFTNAMNNLLGYPHSQDDLVRQMTGYHSDEIRNAMKWLGRRAVR